jgi:hypothetical protein
VNVICHEAVRVQAASRPRTELAQVRQVNEVVGVVQEAISSIVAALHNVQRDLWHD